MATAFASFGAVSALQEQVYITRFCFSVVGALLGFLWFNIKPASLLMGRTGAYSLGATLAVVAMMTGQWPLLLLIGAIPLIEIGSQVLDRIFSRMDPPRPLLLASPLHAHLAVLGWSNTQIIQRFWVVSLLFAMIGISLSRV
jgi:phospho-N-acetylmuramoyl-pentapeptide-transferase